MFHKYRNVKKIANGVYEIDGKVVNLTNVTAGIVSKIFPKFNADEVIKNMMEKENWDETHRYWGKTPAQIKKMWDENGKRAAEEGQTFHKEVEKCLVEGLSIGKSLERINKSAFTDPAFLEFKKFANDKLHLQTCKLEWHVFDLQSKIHGIIDAVFLNEDGTVDIYDWKRKKEISKYGRKFYNQIFGELMDCEKKRCEFQLNAYRVILERNYTLKVRKMKVVRFYPDELYEEVSCDVIPEMELYFDNQM